MMMQSRGIKTDRGKESRRSGKRNEQSKEHTKKEKNKKADR